MMYLLDELSSMLRGIARLLLLLMVLYGVYIGVFILYVVVNYARLRAHSYFCMEPWTWGSDFCNSLNTSIEYATVMAHVQDLLKAWYADALAYVQPAPPQL